MTQMNKKHEKTEKGKGYLKMSQKMKTLRRSIVFHSSNVLDIPTKERNFFNYL